MVYPFYRRGLGRNSWLSCTASGTSWECPLHLFFLPHLPLPYSHRGNEKVMAGEERARRHLPRLILTG